MKRKGSNAYLNMLKESTIDFGKMEDYSGTVGDLIGFSGKGKLPAYKEVGNVVNILERFYQMEESEEGEVPNSNMVGMGPEKKLDNSPAEDDEKLEPIADEGGGAEPPTQGDYDTPMDGGKNVKEDIDSLVESLFEDDDLLMEDTEIGDSNDILIEEGEMTEEELDALLEMDIPTNKSDPKIGDGYDDETPAQGEDSPSKDTEYPTSKPATYGDDAPGPKDGMQTGSLPTAKAGMQNEAEGDDIIKTPKEDEADEDDDESLEEMYEEMFEGDDDEVDKEDIIAGDADSNPDPSEEIETDESEVEDGEVDEDFNLEDFEEDLEEDVEEDLEEDLEESEGDDKMAKVRAGIKTNKDEAPAKEDDEYEDEEAEKDVEEMFEEDDGLGENMLEMFEEENDEEVMSKPEEAPEEDKEEDKEDLDIDKEVDEDFTLEDLEEMLESEDSDDKEDDKEEDDKKEDDKKEVDESANAREALEESIVDRLIQEMEDTGSTEEDFNLESDLEEDLDENLEDYVF